jgi:hypothetical protein
MAEGGEKNEDNPFSFKKFVSPRDKENETTEESEHTMANGQVLDILPDIGDSSNKNRRKERATLVISDDGKLWNIYIVHCIAKCFKKPFHTFQQKNFK